MKNFALIGASGYIAPRHMKAIKDKRTEEFKAELKEERMKLITDNWETTLEEAENK